MKEYKIGYTQGVFDLFHIGHLNLLRAAADLCEKLYVGVNSDKLVNQYKNKTPVIDEKSRLEIVRAIRFVEDACIVNTLDKVEILKQIPFDVCFIGSDWKGSDRWIKTEHDLNELGKTVYYLKYTTGISSTELRNVLKK